MGIELVSQAVRFGIIGDVEKSIVVQGGPNPAASQLGSEPGVPIAVELKPKGTPRRDAQVTETEVFIEKVEIVVQTLAVGKLQHVFPSRLVVPGKVGPASFHRRKDMHQARRIAARLQNRLHPVFFAKRPLANELDFELMRLSHRLGLQSDFFAEGHGKFGVIKEPNALRSQIASHPGRITKRMKIATDENPIIAMENAINLIRIFFQQWIRCHRSPQL
ncbi:MAG: hypothetical protein AAB427_00970 [Chloroflexota bacterium]